MKSAQPLIVIIGYVWPEPKSSAAGSRMLCLIEFFLKQNWRVIFASASVLSERRFDLAQWGVAEQTILLNDTSFDQWIAQVNPQAVLYDRFFTEEQFGWRVDQACPQAVRILDTEDLQGLRNVRENLLKKKLHDINQYLRTQVSQDLGVVLETPQELAQLMVQDELALREIAAIYRCDLSLIISRYEMDLLIQALKIPEHLLIYWPLIATHPTNSHESPSFAEREHFVAIGNFRHPPNWDSVQLLKDWIWPALQHKLRSQNINAELHVYGAYPPPKANLLNNPKEKFLVKGWADDALQVMSRARVCLAPLRFGAGQKGKLLDALMAATPSVTTGIGVEAMTADDSNGLAAQTHWSGAVENNLADFVDAAFKLYTSETIWLAAQQKADVILQNQFNFQPLELGITQKLIQVTEQVDAHRLTNLVGVLLRQNQHRSTQFMGKWIEAKNKLQAQSDL